MNVFSQAGVESAHSVFITVSMAEEDFERAFVINGLHNGYMDLNGLDGCTGNEIIRPKINNSPCKPHCDIRDQCLRVKVPFFFKQWGGVQKKRAGEANARRSHLRGQDAEKFGESVHEKPVRDGLAFL
ncbi:MAG: hypothetical protein ABI986_00210 [Chloroflexota bacterium]